ncbi:hypothetical protein H257_19112 [Aphanomyces astaci]|uniref:Uncharacterized protein n=1 Tax=Aphanomyces astaci TaxID=112090 RepID=W4FB57_APHAT|nr:hypothetical protein H257_19112 [Aphanomyces astaci]ETV63953.1 hypothetical protein H257_19112 [Aphanomyces astaci]|eukprot:XP_009846561.1 hypothetical protein H257_19112 [Aphanomyces astaci]
MSAKTRVDNVHERTDYLFKIIAAITFAKTLMTPCHNTTQVLHYIIRDNLPAWIIKPSTTAAAVTVVRDLLQLPQSTRSVH